MDSDDFVPFTSDKEASLENRDSTEVSSYTMPALITDVRAPWMQFSQSNCDGDSSFPWWKSLGFEGIKFHPDVEYPWWFDGYSAPRLCSYFSFF
jgi:hypothetical protein